MNARVPAVARMDARHRMLGGLIVAAIVGVVVRTHAVWSAALAIYDAFAFVVLALMCLTIALTPVDRIRAVAQRQDADSVI